MEKKLLALHMYQKELLKFQKRLFCSFWLASLEHPFYRQKEYIGQEFDLLAFRFSRSSRQFYKSYLYPALINQARNGGTFFEEKRGWSDV